MSSFEQDFAEFNDLTPVEMKEGNFERFSISDIGNEFGMALELDDIRFDGIIEQSI